VPRRSRIVQTLAGTLILLISLVSVGLTAPSDGPFSIRIHPIGFRFDSASIDDTHGRALGLDIVVTLGSRHAHYVWSAISLLSPSTKRARTLL
jgi:hypothetical protein